MARGFLAGVLLGGLAGAGALAALSLLAPLPQGGVAPLSVGLPVGSEFGRGGDLTPRLPAPNAAGPRIDTRPAAVPAPEGEPAPVAVTGDTARPETLADDRIPAQDQPPAVDDAPGLTLPQAAPRTQLSVPQPMAGPVQDDTPRIAPDSAAAPDDRPAMPSPALDLSLPPDLTDLRRLERN
ncbi:hypothetical protein [Paracoccus hibiscisoli]|uniref:Uncharacterized protein n=1 Tax=Paracoccus hibiscisoli TaxID=2023261 RepID=A0A4U0QKU4_9RHOB|nr:hypothetical protein [Paracoccus hibiscisoli]TJZ82276.1 hypothetical protein FA740_15310 [Paracoccus hibiscisoli]